MQKSWQGEETETQTIPGPHVKDKRRIFPRLIPRPFLVKTSRDGMNGVHALDECYMCYIGFVLFQISFADIFFQN